jgi:hypothetical protein
LTLRRSSFERVLALVLLAGSTVTAIAIALLVEPAAPLDDALVFGLSGVVAWLSWRVILRTRTTLTSTDLLVVNALVQYEIPLTAIEDVRSDWRGLLVRTSDGFAIRPAVLQTTVGPRTSGATAFQYALDGARRAVAQDFGEGCTPRPTRRDVRLELVPFIMFAAACFALIRL